MILELDSWGWEHVHTALLRHAAQMRRDGIPLPEDVAALLVLAQANSGQQRPSTAPQRVPYKPEFVTMEQAGQVLGMSARTIRRRTVDGSLPFIRVGRRKRIPVAALEALRDRASGRKA